MNGAPRRGLRITIDKLVIILLFLFSLNLLNLSGILIALSILVFIVFNLRIIKVDWNTAILVLFSVFYFGSVAFYEGFSIDTIIKFAVAPWGCYIIGYNLRLKNDEISVTKLTTILALGFFIHGMLNLSSSIKIYGAGFNNTYRLAYDFWQSRQISVTTAALYYSPLALMAIGGVFFAKRRAIKHLSFGAILLSLYATLIYQNRTLIMAMLFILIVNVVLVIKDSDIQYRRKMGLIVGIIILTFVFAVGWFRNLFGIRVIFESTNLYGRLTGSDQDRTKIWASFVFGEAWKYPFGGNKAVLYNNKPYVHNVWLDTFRRTGVLSFAFLILFTIVGIKETIIFSHRTDRLKENVGIIVSLLLGITILFMVEPIIEANPYVFYFPIIAIGAICGSNSEYRKEVIKY